MPTERPMTGLTDVPDVADAKRQQPQRTCVGCRRHGGRSALLRVVAKQDGDAVVALIDQRRRMPGRGLWLHPDEHCVEKARRRSAFARALHVRGPVDTSQLFAQLQAVLQDPREVPDPTSGPGQRPPPGSDDTGRDRPEASRTLMSTP